MKLLSWFAKVSRNSQYEIDGQQLKVEIVELQELVESLRFQLSESHGVRDQLNKNVEYKTTYVLEMEEKVYRSNKISLEILKLGAQKPLISLRYIPGF